MSPAFCEAEFEVNEYLSIRRLNYDLCVFNPGVPHYRHIPDVNLQLRNHFALYKMVYLQASAICKGLVVLRGKFTAMVSQ